MSKPYHITVCGHLGGGQKLADGQTVKTQIIVSALKDIYGDEMIFVCDTYRWKRRPLHMFIQCIQAAKNSSDVVMLPADKGVFIFIPLFSILKMKYSTRLHYSVIGGWLAAKLKKSPFLAYYLHSFTTIQVETSQMRKDLEKYQFKNIHVVPNFKTIDAITIADSRDHTFTRPLPLCTFSRVMHEKGIEDAIKVVTKINLGLEEPLYTLDIYGAIDGNYRERFIELMKRTPDEISYKGVIESNKSVSILKNYYLLLFPTHYATEGLPGTIIDGYAAGLPVVSSRWNSFSDVITEGKTGYGVELDNNQQLYKILKKLADTQLVLPLKENCIDAFSRYSYSQGCRLIQACIENDEGHLN